MRISSWNVNKFQGAYSNPQTRGGYYNPRNIDFKTPIKKLISSCIKEKDDIVFLQEFYDNNILKTRDFFAEDLKVLHNECEGNFNDIKSHVVAITRKDSSWKLVEQTLNKSSLGNKWIEVELSGKNLRILSFHNTGEAVKERVNREFRNKEKMIILGDFNDSYWIKDIKNKYEYDDIITDDDITFKPAQTAIDRVFINWCLKYEKVGVSSIVTETYLSDHNLLSLEIKLKKENWTK